jgi:multidrug resistance efflux pump
MSYPNNKSKFSFNILYWLILPIIALACYQLSKVIIINRHQEFYGYTDTKETQLSIDMSSFVEKIIAKPGQSVKQGDTLIILSKTNIDKDVRRIDAEIALENEKKQYTQAEILASISKINAETSAKVSQLESEIRIEQSKLEYTRSMINSTSTAKQSSLTDHPSSIKINQLQNEIITLKSQTLSIINKYNSLLNENKKQKAATDKLIIDKNHLIESKNKLYIIAPFDGLVGNINCKEMEYVTSSSSMLSFYESSPVTVIGFVHESMILNVKSGDTAYIQSVLQSKLEPINGVVSGIGHRIVEIPERLRKIPELKTYGMEVYITIPAQNKLLQKEMVKIMTKTPEISVEK